jgi:ElaA protein
MTTAWTWARFGELRPDDLYDALALRSRVFVVEQNCVFLDADGFDQASWHLLGRAEVNGKPGALVSYLRVVDPGLKYEAPSIGRVITAPEVRRSGAGRELMAEGIVRCISAWPGRGIRIGAQARLESFYNDFGFVREGQAYIEDDIPHLEMWRAP